jgi:methionyl-tRNA synthetase
MVRRYRDGRVPAARPVLPGGEDLDAACRLAGHRAGAALGEFDFRQATAAVWAIADEANRFINRVRPWELAKAERGGDAAAGHRLDAALCQLTGACSALGRELAPFLPDAAARITAQTTPAQTTPAQTRLPAQTPVFRRLGGG